MIRYVCDTHPLVWHLSSDQRLSAMSKRIFASADAGLAQVLMPGIVLIEMVYLVEKGVVKREFFDQTVTLLDTPNGSYQVATLDQRVAHTMLTQVAWAAVPELADRIVVATALSLGLPLITKDQTIRNSGIVQGAW
jgi:PIN domain nuclease of toxin-antitoxin system